MLMENSSVNALAHPHSRKIREMREITKKIIRKTTKKRTKRPRTITRIITRIIAIAITIAITTTITHQLLQQQHVIKIEFAQITKFLLIMNADVRTDTLW